MNTCSSKIAFSIFFSYLLCRERGGEHNADFRDHQLFGHGMDRRDVESSTQRGFGLQSGKLLYSGFVRHRLGECGSKTA